MWVFATPALLLSSGASLHRVTAIVGQGRRDMEAHAGLIAGACGGGPEGWHRGGKSNMIQKRRSWISIPEEV